MRGSEDDALAIHQQYNTYTTNMTIPSTIFNDTTDNINIILSFSSVTEANASVYQSGYVVE